MNGSITVLLAEDHVVVREGLRILIEADGDIKVVGEAVTGREAVLMARQLHPDVVVMDIAMPLLNGIQATQQILSQSPKAKILILSAHADPEYVDQLMALGVVGYLTKQTSAEMVARAVAAGYRNLAWMRTDTDLDPLRSREDFRLLLMDLAFPAEPFIR